MSTDNPQKENLSEKKPVLVHINKSKQNKKRGKKQEKELRERKVEYELFQFPKTFDKLSGNQKVKTLKKYSENVKKLRKRLAKKNKEKKRGKNNHSIIVQNILKVHEKLQSSVKLSHNEEDRSFLEDLFSLINTRKMKLSSQPFKKIVKEIDKCITQGRKFKIFKKSLYANKKNKNNIESKPVILSSQLPNYFQTFNNKPLIQSFKLIQNQLLFLSQDSLFYNNINDIGSNNNNLGINNNIMNCNNNNNSNLFFSSQSNFYNSNTMNFHNFGYK